MTEEEKPLKVLLVDDTQMNLELASRVLARRGHSVVTADDGEKAIAAFQSGLFDVVLMDMVMPVLDGLEAARRIRAWESAARQQDPARRRTPVIAMTANDQESDKERCRQAGMDGFITKPLEIKTVIATIRQIIAAAPQ